MAPQWLTRRQSHPAHAGDVEGRVEALEAAVTARHILHMRATLKVQERSNGCGVVYGHILHMRATLKEGFRRPALLGKPGHIPHMRATLKDYLGGGVGVAGRVTSRTCGRR